MASLLKSAFSVSISGQHSSQHLLRHQADIKQALHQASIKEDHTIARPVCLFERARGAVGGEATHVFEKFSLSQLSYFYACRIKQMLVLKNG